MVGKARQDQPSTPGLYLLGGSSARESIVSGDALAAEIADLGGPRVAAYDLGSINQNFAQSLAVVDSAPDTPAWLLVGINLGRFTATEGDERRPGRGSRAPARERRRAGLRLLRVGPRRSTRTRSCRASGRTSPTGCACTAASCSRATSPSTEYELHRYSAQTRRSDGQKKRLVEKWNTSRKPVFEQNLDANLQMLEALLAQARERGVRVVLLELPINEEIVGDSFDDSRRQYQEPVSALAREYGAPYLDLNRTVDIPSRDFQDLSHLIAPGRAVWQHALAKELAPLLSKDSGGSSG